MDMFGTKTVRFTQTALLAALLMMLCILPSASRGQEYLFEEIVVNFDVPKLVNADIFVQFDGTTIYLPLFDIFRRLEINYTLEREKRKISGYLMTKNNDFEINVEQGLVRSLGQEFPLAPGSYYFNGMEFYLRIDYYKEFFGLDMAFNFSKLKVSMPLNKDFPAYQKLKRKLAQEKLRTKKKEAREVYTLPLKREYFKGGVADWMISTSPLGNRRTHYLTLGIGSMLLGGDFAISGVGNTRAGVDLKQLRYKWHYYVGENKYLTQAELGQVFTGSIISRGLDGALVTNKPQVRREFFQTIRLSDYLGEGWEVELYIDGRLTDFTHTDETGTYNFNVDVFYGASTILLKMYGPNGEIRTEETHTEIPFNLIPKGELEYTAAIGKSDTYNESGIFSQANCYYGITTNLTIGFSGDLPIQNDLPDTGEYKSRPRFAAELAFQPLPNLTINGSIVPEYFLNGGFSFSRSSLFNFSGRFTLYKENPIHNPLGQLHNIVISVATTPKIFGHHVGFRVNVSNDQYPQSNITGAYYGFTGTFYKFYLNYIGQYKITKLYYANREFETATSQLLIGSRIFRWVRPQLRVDYNHSLQQVTRYGIYLTKRIFKTGQLTLSFERNEIGKSNLFMLTFNIFTVFASFNTRFITSSNQIAMTESQSGSVRYNNELGSFHFDRYSGVGQGSAILVPYMDNNFNGRYDETDEYVPGLRARIKGASGRPTGEDQAFYYNRLRPYDEYIVEIDEYSLDNPLLKPVHEGYRISFNPNVVTAIEVPIVTAGEVSGSVHRQTSSGAIGLGGAKIRILNLATGIITELTTFNNGEFYLMGLIPGSYRAMVDRNQMSEYGYRSEPEVIDFEVKAVEGGDIVEGIKFLLHPVQGG